MVKNFIVYKLYGHEAIIMFVGVLEYIGSIFPGIISLPGLTRCVKILVGSLSRLIGGQSPYLLLSFLEGGLCGLVL